MIKQFVKAVISRSYYLNNLVFKLYDSLRRVRCQLSQEGGAKIKNYGAAKIKKDVIGKSNSIVINRGAVLHKTKIKIRGNNNNIIGKKNNIIKTKFNIRRRLYGGPRVFFLDGRK